MVTFPNAKINLGLNILRRRPDGYHDIATVMVGVDWRDILEIVPSRLGTDMLTVTGREVKCAPEKNLVFKALMALRKVVDVPPVEIYLHKIIPDGAGLGGGSADAAFTLTTLNRMFELRLDDCVLSEVAAKVGSDCPFFIFNRPMLATGRGEVLSFVEGLDSRLSDYKVVIIKDEDCSVSTAEAYAGVMPRPKEFSPEIILRRHVGEWRCNLFNDFEESIIKLVDSPARIKARLYELGATYSAMTGSGSAVFGIFDREALKHVDFEMEFAGSTVHAGDFILD